MNYEVLTYGYEELRRKAVPVARINSDIKTLAKDMLRVMYASNGVGLAAEQIGRTEAICVVDVTPLKKRDDDEKQSAPDPMLAHMPLVMINPEITAAEGQATAEEGCLSFPEIYVSVRRAAQVTVTYLDPDNKKRALTAAGLAARAIQHEVDHLNGILLVDRMSAVQKVANAGRLKRLKKSAATA